MLGEQRQKHPATQPPLRAIPAAPSSFHTSVLPWYRDIQAVPRGGHQRFRTLRGEALGINIQCPAETIDGYVGLLCQEAELVHALLPGSLPVSSLWLRGSPSRQFSPEAVTELVFRLNARFPLAAMTAIRGLDLPSAALNSERLALLTGLGFNRIGLRIDATLGSDERSLAKLHGVLEQLMDFPTLGVHYEIRFGSRSHHRYLLRLLQAIRRTPALSIELIDPEQAGPGALSERRETGELLALAIAGMTGDGWCSYGNAFFVPPDSALQTAGFRAAAHFTPWGPQPVAGRLWLGLGIGAFGYCHPCYYRTTESAAAYRQALEIRQLPEKTLYCLSNEHPHNELQHNQHQHNQDRHNQDRHNEHQHNEYRSNECQPSAGMASLHTTQSLLCRLELPRDAEPALAAKLLADGLIARTTNPRLTPEGIVRLSAIIRHLQTRARWGDHLVQSHVDRHPDV